MAVTIKWLSPDATTPTGTTISNIDFGTIIAGESATKSFKIGNTGTSLAENVVVKSIGSGEAVAWKKYKLGDGSYVSTLTLPNLVSNGISDLITIESTVPSNAPLGTHTTTTEVSYIYS